MKKLILFSLLMCFLPSCFSQNSEVIVSEKINSSRDTIVIKNLIKSLNGFLSQKEKPNKENTFVLKEDLLEMSLLLDEIKEMEKNEELKDDNFYKCYLQKVSELKDNVSFIIQISYIGIINNIPLVRANFEFLAKKVDDHFCFYSPFKRNTVSYKSKKIENFTFYFKNKLNIKKAKEYVKKVNYYDDKLKNPKFETVIYCFSDFSDVLINSGILFKSDYFNDYSQLSANENDKLLIANGASNASFDSFDPHDLWHDRLHIQYTWNATNRPVDEGYAYLNGGSWQVFTWQDILKKFKEKVCNNKNINWLDVYGKFENFNENPQIDLLPEYVINALIVEKIENEIGFSAVLELLKCGKYEKTNDNYFKALEKIIGINRENFNEKIWELINKTNP